LTPIGFPTITRFSVSSRRACRMKLPEHERILLVNALVRYKLRGRPARCQAIRSVLRTISARSGSLKITACGGRERPGLWRAEPPQTRFARSLAAGIAPALG
jgi:hypothetical protein